MRLRVVVSRLPNPAKQSGLTLIELFVVLCLMVIVTGAISRMLMAAWEAQEAVTGQNLMQKYAQQAADAVVDRLRGASAITAGTGADITAAYPNGDTVRYYLDSGMLKRTSYSHASGQTGSGEIISRSVASLSFSYYAISVMNWQPAATASLAQSVVVSVTMVSGRDRATESSVVKLRNKA